MVYLALALGWVLTTCLFAYLLLKVLERQSEECQAHRIEVDRLSTSHAEQIAKMGEDHRREVANLCQRIQAPQVAVAEHAAINAPPDPPQIDLENDLAMIADRERQLREFAEELSTER